MFGGCEQLTQGAGVGVLAGLQGPRQTSEAQLPPGARSYEGLGRTLPGPCTHREPCSGHGRPRGAGPGVLGPLTAAVPPEGQRSPCPTGAAALLTPAVRNRILGQKTMVSSFCIKWKQKSRRSCHSSPLSATRYLAFGFFVTVSSLVPGTTQQILLVLTQDGCLHHPLLLVLKKQKKRWVEKCTEEKKCTFL